MRPFGEPFATVCRIAGVAATALAATAILLAAPVAASTAKRAIAPGESDSALVSQVISRLANRLPNGVKVEAVKLGCKPPLGASLKSVAPGVRVLRSRGFLIEFTTAGQPLMCSAILNAKRPVLAAIHDIGPNRPVSRKDFITAFVDAFGGAPGALSHFPGGGPWVSAVRILAGKPLYRTQLARVLAVHPGDMVMVVVRNGPVIVHTMLEARAAASVGQTVPMVNPNSGAVVEALVTGLRTARVVIP